MCSGCDINLSLKVSSADSLLLVADMADLGPRQKRKQRQRWRGALAYHQVNAIAERHTRTCQRSWCNVNVGKLQRLRLSEERS